MLPSQGRIPWPLYLSHLSYDFLYLISFLPSTQQIHVRSVCLTYNMVSITISWHDQWKHWSHTEAGRKAHSKAQEHSQHWSTCRSENGNYTEVHSPQVVETVVPFLKQDICQSTRKSVHIYVWNFKSSCDFYKSVVGKHLLAPSVQESKIKINSMLLFEAQQNLTIDRCSDVILSPYPNIPCEVTYFLTLWNITRFSLWLMWSETCRLVSGVRI